MYSKDDFECYTAPAPPPTPGPKNEGNVGKMCTTTKDCGNDADKETYCCGFATGGQLLDENDKPISGGAATFNSVACNYNKDTQDAVAMQVGYKNSDGSQITIEYPATSFVCLTGAKALLASASVFVAAVSMM